MIFPRLAFPLSIQLVLVGFLMQSIWNHPITFFGLILLWWTLLSEFSQFDSLFQLLKITFIQSQQDLEDTKSTFITFIKKTKCFSPSFYVLFKSEKKISLKDQNRTSFFLRTHTIAICDHVVFSLNKTIFLIRLRKGRHVLIS
jgi:hypothetical protein